MTNVPSFLSIRTKDSQCLWREATIDLRKPDVLSDNIPATPLLGGKEALAISISVASRISIAEVTWPLSRAVSTELSWRSRCRISFKFSVKVWLKEISFCNSSTLLDASMTWSRRYWAFSYCVTISRAVFFDSSMSVWSRLAWDIHPSTWGADCWLRVQISL